MTLALTVLWALFLIETKHLVVDWVMQPPFEHRNKHIFGHWGGIRHAGKNAIGTGIALIIGFSGALSLPVVLGLTILDFVVHYFVDFGKTNVTRACGWGPTTHAEFWWLTGFDQYLHQATYLVILLLALLSL